MIISKIYMILFVRVKQKPSFAPQKANQGIAMVMVKRHLLLPLFFISAMVAGQKGANQFISPLKIPLYLSASFGELRADHFHSGIDIKTQGVTGKEVIASDDGYVYLLLVSPGGFGRAIFIRHPSGYSTVYAHLDRYKPEIEDYVKTKQYENKSFGVTVYPPEEKFKVSKGEIIAWSGNSGSSTGPHLHYEIRKSDGEKPVNPLLFNFGIEDNLKPIIERLAIYPGSASATVNGRNESLYLNLTGADGKYSLPDNTELIISGLAGFGVLSYDYMNNTSSRFGINSIELQIDSMPWFSYEINEFSFYETRYINAHIDYEAAVRNNVDIERTFVLPNDKLSLYKSFMNSGLYDFTDNKTHSVKIIVKDGNNNKSVLSFNVRQGVQKRSVSIEKQDSSIIVMPFGKNNTFITDGVKVDIPSGALYDTLHFKFSRTRVHGRLLSDILHIHNRFTPLQISYNLSIKPDTIPPGKASKLLIVQLGDNNKMSYAGGTFSDGYVKADLLSFGNYAISMDTIPPAISTNGLFPGINLSDKKEIRVRITDNFSGIKGYTGVIDGKWSLFEYDPRYDLLVYKFDPERITKGTNHKLYLRVTDNMDNASTYNCDFIW
jgi:hypothetical protein